MEPSKHPQVDEVIAAFTDKQLTNAIRNILRRGFSSWQVIHHESGAP